MNNRPLDIKIFVACCLIFATLGIFDIPNAAVAIGANRNTGMLAKSIYSINVLINYLIAYGFWKREKYARYVAVVYFVLALCYAVINFHVMSFEKYEALMRSSNIVATPSLYDSFRYSQVMFIFIGIALVVYVYKKKNYFNIN